MFDNGPSDPSSRKGVGEEVRKAGPAVRVPWPPNRRRRNSLCLRCSSFSRLLSWACSSEKDKRLKQKKIVTEQAGSCCSLLMWPHSVWKWSLVVSRFFHRLTWAETYFLAAAASSSSSSILALSNWILSCSFFSLFSVSVFLYTTQTCYFQLLQV